MSAVNLMARELIPSQLRAASFLHHRRRQLMRIHPDPLMGSMLSEWIKKTIKSKKEQGLDLQIPVGKGSIGLNVPGSGTPSGTPSGAPSGVMSMVKNPLVLAGVGGAGLLLVLFLVKRKGAKK
jgi:hypothetical protein